MKWAPEATCFARFYPCFRPCINVCPRLCYVFPISPVKKDFRQTYVTGAWWDKDELIRFWGQTVKGQGHIIAAEASSTRCCHQVQLSSFRNFYVIVTTASLVSWATRISLKLQFFMYVCNDVIILSHLEYITLVICCILTIWVCKIVWSRQSFK